MTAPADAILLRLKTGGPASTAELAAHLGVTRQAVRLQTDKLAAQGLLAGEQARGGVGRPGAVWNLTAAGHARFPDAHAQVTVELLEAVREEFGPAGLDRLIRRREDASRNLYMAALAADADLEARLDRLTRLRAAEGYMAEWSSAGDGTYVLVENHCPICAAATACQGFCRSELTLFREALAPATVDRIDHILQGARRCAYLVTPP
ncbi:metalloregulator ArsR/SmtB family transcription factor [Phenylobacterium sp.]|jgi:predicted ArsR family transcriptional regulator|uniref:helix-turn-helix transcriptional regulator n=1 Tax=Phenylobacterium sp. TaxID=1871053 RepID=UPI000C8AE3E8|nr:metalloregulator ArsR/SmtB family transcription factor [Phenylobacterium sp.]MAK82039.1 MarR family transcriptional regulator [Phenylobacterium sp.]|tara:strand:+ start:5949 stop:6569 length:621 start_codon:yes stop_codon:yes gene_type:complete